MEILIYCVVVAFIVVVVTMLFGLGFASLAKGAASIGKSEESKGGKK